MLEVGVQHTVGEALAANTNTLKYTVTSQLMHNQTGIDNTYKNMKYIHIKIYLYFKQ